MRRADRLFRIVEYLKARKNVVTAVDLARATEVSTRTIYRDIYDLTLSGCPIISEPGVGYILDRNHILSPLTFSVKEIDALMLGTQTVQSWADEDLAKSARSAADKILSVLPVSIRKEFNENCLFAFPTQSKPRLEVDFSLIRKSIRTKNIIKFLYTKEDGKISQRIIKPLGLAFFAPVWLLLGWEEEKQDFRNFRIDRMSKLEITDDKFMPEKGKRLADFIKLSEIKPFL